MNNRITYIGLYAFSLYSFIMSLICGIIVLLLVMLCITLFLYCKELNYIMFYIVLFHRKFAYYRCLFISICVYGINNPVLVVSRENLDGSFEGKFNEFLEICKWTVVDLYDFLIKGPYFLPTYLAAWQLMLFIQNKKAKVMYTSNTVLEVCWTILPIGILISIMLPSLVLLYAMDDVSIAFGNVTMKVIGHQWYWSYQHVNMSPELMPVFHDINKLAYIKSNWLSSLTKL